MAVKMGSVIKQLMYTLKIIVLNYHGQYSLFSESTSIVDLLDQ